ncbi:hypothetical protein FCM35_KLT13405 [Carex littledalei]|uniref:Uncharacterized protein n=1 Tax=Carex littledalei TaxID=544730 RepID=A0A833QNW7_9POAL|nr:hypothetical protein FCM35_KLT13405 [Carex littledalei]
MDVFASLLALLLTVLIKGLFHIIKIFIKNVAVVCFTTLLVNIFWLCKRISPSYVESLPQLGEEEDSVSVPQQREEEGSVPGPQYREKEGSTPVPESRNQNFDVLHQNNSVADAISRIDFRLASEPGFIIDSGFQRCLRFEAIPEPSRASFVAILDDFWGQLFDLEGNLTKKAKLIRLDALLGLDVVHLGIEYSRKRLGQD